MPGDCKVLPTDFTASFDCGCPRCKSRVLGALGFASMAIILSGIIIAVLSYPGYDFLNQFVSDLGIVTSSPASGVFNGAMIVGGAFLAMFSVMCLAVPTRYRQFTFGTMFFGFMAGIAFFAGGFYPYDTFTAVHIAITLLVFAGMLGSSLSFSIAIFYQDQNNIPRMFGVVGLVAFAVLLVLSILAASNGIIPDIASRPAVYNAAIIEWIGMLLYLGWVFTISIHELY